MKENQNIKQALYNYCKSDHDFIQEYKSFKGSLNGFNSYLSDTIDLFINDFDIYLDKPFLDLSYLEIGNLIIDIDLLFDLFKDLPLYQNMVNLYKN